LPYALEQVCANEQQENICRDTVIFTPNYFLTPFKNELEYLRDIGLYYREKYRVVNHLHSYLPKYFSGYEYKYDKVFNETLGFQDWNEDYNSFFFSQELLDVY
jgi:hypothetical protein